MERAFLFFFLFTASISDLKYRRIDNLLNFIFFTSGVIFSFLKRGAGGAADGIVTALAVFAFTFVLYGAGLMGAGDIKFIMAAAAFSGSGMIRSAVVPAVVFCIPITAISVIRTEKGQRPAIPMAIPISLGILYALQQTR